MAPLPSQLDIIIKQHPGDDLANLLSQEFLQYVYARKLREPDENLKKADTTHPMWKNLVDRMSCESLPKAPDGLSRTMLGQIKQYATAVKNHWEGASYGKLLQAVIRILLRMHLAPIREKAYKERIKALARKKQEEIVEPGTQKASKYHEWKTAHLLDEVAVAFEDNKQRLAQSLLRRIFKLGVKDPISTTKSGPSESQVRYEADMQITAMDHDVQQQALAGPGILKDDKDDKDEEAQVRLATDMFEDELDRILRTDLEADLDEVDAAMEEAMEDTAITESAYKEPSRAHLRSLEVVLRMLLETPNVATTIDANYVAKQAHKGKKFSPEECRVVADLANRLRPYIPKRRQDKDGRYEAPLAHVAARAPFLILGNCILRAAGYHPFTKTTSPQISPSSTQALPLGAPGMYEVFCASAAEHFDVKTACQKPLTNISDTVKPDNKRAIFGSFLDLDKVDFLCAEHGLKFANR